ncbi:unnamed protein product [Notodromas monacha]|uniref:C2H2-type domain-containing protein n=1 Tax=Notodromas monacha TaxID=399045 RepID=A0A7R9BFC6_9CRUS|nr:unnamed protein product [Notodromas monacha]CAG0914365.1 unnamed protein product [Notodromas monacha]
MECDLSEGRVSRLTDLMPFGDARSENNLTNFSQLENLNDVSVACYCGNGKSQFDASSLQPMENIEEFGPLCNLSARNTDGESLSFEFNGISVPNCEFDFSTNGESLFRILSPVAAHGVESQGQKIVENGDKSPVHEGENPEKQTTKENCIMRSADLPVVEDRSIDIPVVDRSALNDDGAKEEDRRLEERKKALQMLNFFNKVSAGRVRSPAELKCTICTPHKLFTAQTSLVCHYRSHAGIKPYICSTCGSSFTRQHSLNYHMMLHTNAIKFKCEVCQHVCRHRSHFKEHMRKHTGETPFECSECKRGFKTRNTYKRHLYYRHGKILTAEGGVIIMAPEEFKKVKTNPRPKGKRKRARKCDTASDSVDLDTC